MKKIWIEKKKQCWETANFNKPCGWKSQNGVVLTKIVEFQAFLKCLEFENLLNESKKISYEGESPI